MYIYSLQFYKHHNKSIVPCPYYYQVFFNVTLNFCIAVCGDSLGHKLSKVTHVLQIYGRACRAILRGLWYLLASPLFLPHEIVRIILSFCIFGCYITVIFIGFSAGYFLIYYITLSFAPACKELIWSFWILLFKFIRQGQSSICFACLLT